MSSGPCAGFLSGVAATVFLAGCSLPEPLPLKQLYDRLDSGGLAYFHADFGRLSESPALLEIVEAIGGAAFMTLQADLAAGVVMSAKTQLVIRTESAYTGTLAALGSAHVERLEDRLILINLDSLRPLAEPPSKSLQLPDHDESAAVQIRFLPPSLYELAKLAPEGFNLKFIAKALQDAQAASLTIPSDRLHDIHLTLAAGDAERIAALRESISQSLRFVEAVMRATDRSSVWLPAIESCSIEFSQTAVRVSLPLSDEILSNLQNRLSQPGTDR